MAKLSKRMYTEHMQQQLQALQLCRHVMMTTVIMLSNVHMAMDEMRRNYSLAAQRHRYIAISVIT